MIRFPCPRCGAALKAPDKRAGQKVTCPECERAVPVPEPDDAPPAELDDETPRRKFPGWAWGAIAAALGLVVLVVILATRGSRSQPDPVPVDDAQAIVGRWELVSGVSMQDGVRSEHPGERRSRGPEYFRFERDNLETNKGDTAAFVLDTTKSPKWITVTFEAGLPGQRFADGIYELKGDELRICWAPRAKQGRPASFTDLGRNCVVMVFRRAR